MEMAMIPLPRCTSSAVFSCDFSGAAANVAHSFQYQRQEDPDSSEFHLFAPKLTGLKVYTLLAATVSVMLKQMLFPNANAFSESYLIAFLFLFLHSHYPCPDEARPRVSPSQGSCRLDPEEQLLGFTDLLASR